MLRRPPTRIVLRNEDIEEWEQLQKEKGVEKQNSDPKPKTVEERIGIAKGRK